jgi:Outer membrane protein beta-barrel domain
MKGASFLTALAFTLGATTAGATDFNPLGFYVGGAVGRSDVRANEVAGFGAPQGTSGSPLGFEERRTGWKLVVGMRPISVLGAELAYVDFGHPAALHNCCGNTTGLRTQIDAHPKAFALSGLAYLPLPLPLVDLYAKAGIARLKNEVNAEEVCFFNLGGCPPTPAFGRFALNETSARFAYGAGMQVRVSPFLLRLEYERISASGGDPDLMSIGLAWAF